MFNLKSYVLQSIDSLGADKRDDAAFVKLLLIAFIANTNIKSGYVDPDAIKLIKGSPIYCSSVKSDKI